MNPRAVAGDVAAMAMTIVWVYAGTAVVVSQLGEGQSVSVVSVGVVVVCAHLIARGLSRLDVGVGALRLIGAAISLVILYGVLRVEIAGNVYLWELGWVRDLIADMNASLDGHSGDVALVFLFPGAWMFCVARGSRQLTFERLGGEVGAGLTVVLLAALFADGAGAPGAIAWLPVPYMAIALVSLAIIHIRNVEFDARRPFGQAWALWTVGSLLALAVIAIPTMLVDLGLLGFIGEGLVLIAKGIGLVLLGVLLPPLVGLVWLFQHFLALFGINGEPPKIEMPASPLDEMTKDQNDAAPWTRYVGYVLRAGATALLLALIVALLWLAFQRIRGEDEDDVDAREMVEVDSEGGSIFGEAFGRLRNRFSRGGRGRDAIGRLYAKMLRRAENDGLPRPAAATPNEFAPRLDAHYSSQTPSAISSVFAVARYGGRLPNEQEIQRLNEDWARLSRRRLRDEPP